MRIPLAHHFKHSQILVDGVSTHVLEAGNKDKQPILFLHGYPENSIEFEQVMLLLEQHYRLLAIDLPGIGKTGPIGSSTKLSIAIFIRNLLDALGLDNVVLVGHDVGGMICYTFIKYFPEYLSKVVIMCTAVPGVVPWEQVKRHPLIWHFAFFSVPELPEQLISGKEHLLFDYFYNTMAAHKDAISPERRSLYVQAYSSQVALKTSLEWYRTFAEDEKEEGKDTISSIPVLYLRGVEEHVNIDEYVQGFELSGLTRIRAEWVAESGHFAPEENPDAVSRAIDNFIRKG